MTRIIPRFILTSVLVAALSACGGDDNNGSSPPPPPGGTPPPIGTPPPSPPSTIAAQFGAAFASIFGANRNSEPKDPAPSDLAGVNRTAEPINF